MAPPTWQVQATLCCAKTCSQGLLLRCLPQSSSMMRGAMNLVGHKVVTAAAPITIAASCFLCYSWLFLLPVLVWLP